MDIGDTKEHIYNCFLKLLETRKYDDLNINDIVDLAEVSRQTFYYHYDNMFDLFEYAIDRERKSRIEAYSHESLLDNLGEDIVTLGNLKPLVNAVYRSRSGPKLEMYIFNNAYRQAVEFFRSHENSIGGENVDFVSRFLAHAYAGMVSDWIGTGMSDSIWKSVERVRVLVNHDALYGSGYTASRKV